MSNNIPDLEWSKLPFGYIPTDYNVRCTYRDGKWGEIEVSQSPTIDMHIAATALHYGQEIFEGLKAFRGADGKIRIFRLEENAKRLRSSAEALMMAPVPLEIFREMTIKAVQLNERFIPPYGSGASLYIRPLEIGSSARVGVNLVQSGQSIETEDVRAVRGGMGFAKTGGNYAASLKAGCMAHDKGYSAVLYLDPKEKKYLDECGPANFFAIKGNKYITPASESILPSITNMSLQQLIRDMGMEVEARHIPVEELAEVQEAAACGTAAVCSPIHRIDDLDTGHQYVIAKDGKPGPVTTKLYNTLRAIQYGEIEDVHGWNTVL